MRGVGRGRGVAPHPPPAAAPACPLQRDAGRQVLAHPEQPAREVPEEPRRRGQQHEPQGGEHRPVAPRPHPEVADLRGDREGPRDRLRLRQQAEGLAAEAVADHRGPTAGSLRGREGQDAGEIGARPLQHRRGRPAERGRTRAADAAVVERHHREALVGEERREAAVVRAGHAGGRRDHRGAGRVAGLGGKQARRQQDAVGGRDLDEGEAGHARGLSAGGGGAAAAPRRAAIRPSCRRRCTGTRAARPRAGRAAAARARAAAAGSARRRGPTPGTRRTARALPAADDPWLSCSERPPALSSAPGQCTPPAVAGVGGSRFVRPSDNPACCVDKHEDGTSVLGESEDGPGYWRAVRCRPAASVAWNERTSPLSSQPGRQRGPWDPLAAYIARPKPTDTPQLGGGGVGPSERLPLRQRKERARPLPRARPLWACPNAARLATSMPSVARSFSEILAGYEPVIGLEVHAQLLTRTKLFCSCANRFGAPPNTLVCPVCLGLPGALPVLSGHAVELALRAGLAFGCRINETSVFERKNYFYPDLPKGYQISQYARPLAVHGALEVATADGGTRRVRIDRVHMEEDAGKLLHEGFPWSDAKSGVDLNRAGVPLIEIVSAPDIRSPEEAHVYLTALRAVLLYAEVSDGNMEEGSLRCDANVSVRPRGQEALATRDGDQEPQLVPQRRARARARDRASGRARRVGGRGGAGDAAVECRPRGDGAHALEGRGARLPLLPGARPAGGDGRRGVGRARPRVASRAAGRPPRAASSRPGSSRRTTRSSSRRTAPSPTTSRRSRGRAATPRRRRTG